MRRMERCEGVKKCWGPEGIKKRTREETEDWRVTELEKKKGRRGKRCSEEAEALKVLETRRG